MREVIEALLAAPEYINPAIALASELMEAETREDKEAVKRMSRSVAIEHAIIYGEREGMAVLQACSMCGHSRPVPSKTIPVGF